MSDNYLTDDITDIPLDEVVPLLTALAAVRNNDTNARTELFENMFWYKEDSGTKVSMNKESGYVFLTNEDFQVGMTNNKGQLAMFLTCGECGNEDLEDSFEAYDSCEGCAELVKEIKHHEDRV